MQSIKLILKKSRWNLQENNPKTLLKPEVKEKASAGEPFIQVAPFLLFYIGLAINLVLKDQIRISIPLWIYLGTYAFFILAANIWKSTRLLVCFLLSFNSLTSVLFVELLFVPLISEREASRESGLLLLAPMVLRIKPDKRMTLRLTVYYSIVLVVYLISRIGPIVGGGAFFWIAGFFVIDAIMSLKTFGRQNEQKLEQVETIRKIKRKKQVYKSLLSLLGKTETLILKLEGDKSFSNKGLRRPSRNANNIFETEESPKSERRFHINRFRSSNFPTPFQRFTFPLNIDTFLRDSVITNVEPSDSFLSSFEMPLKIREFLHRLDSVDDDFGLSSNESENLAKAIIKNNDRRSNFREYRIQGYSEAEDPQKSSFTLNLIIFVFQSEKQFVLVNEDKSFEERLRELEELEKLKDRQLAAVAHDLRTPLILINAISQDNRKLLPEGKVKEALRIIEINSSMLLLIANDLLDYNLFKENKLKLQYAEFSLRNLVNECVMLIEFQAKHKGVEISVSSSNTRDTIISDERRLKQVITNLLTNALKFTKKGSINILVEEIPLNETLKIDIIDSGEGIKPEVLRRLGQDFESYNNEKNDNPLGIGLGLVICKKLISHLGPLDELFIDSVEGLGSKFSFFIFLDLRKSAHDKFGSVSERLIKGWEKSPRKRDNHELRSYLRPINRFSFQDKKFLRTMESISTPGQQSNEEEVRSKPEPLGSPLKIKFSKARRSQLSSPSCLEDNESKIRRSSSPNPWEDRHRLMPNANSKGSNLQREKGVTKFETISDERNSFNSSSILGTNSEVSSNQIELNVDAHIFMQADDARKEEKQFDLPKPIHRELCLSSSSSITVGQEHGKDEILETSQEGSQLPVLQSHCNLSPFSNLVYLSMGENGYKFNTLITDDNIFNIFVLENQIRKLNGFDISTTHAANGQEALEMFKKRNRREQNFSSWAQFAERDREKQPFSIIFMDCLMPIMNGYESSRAIKELMTNSEEFFGVLIVGCTAKVCDGEEKKLCFEAGMDYILEKPISEDSLKTLMNSIKSQVH